MWRSMHRTNVTEPAGRRHLLVASSTLSVVITFLQKVSTPMNRSVKLAHLLQTSERLAVAAQRDLSAQVEHCPEWTVLDLVAHIAGVQWFWATIVEGKVQDREHLQRPGGIPANGDPIDWFRAQTMRLHNALSFRRHRSGLDVVARRPERRFVLTRQVNEVVVHCFDAS